MRRLLAIALVVTGVLGVAGCGGGDDNGTTTSTAANSPAGGQLFSQTTHTGSLIPIAGKNDVFTLTLDQPSPDVTSFTDRPIRSASTEPLPKFVDSWDERGFAESPPNAALVLDQQPDNADTAVFTLADPRYNQANGSVSYVATHVNGGTESLPSNEHIDPPPHFGDAHLFIDPSTTAVTNLALDVQNAKGHHVTLNFDAPWQVVAGTGTSGIGFLIGPEIGGGTVLSNKVDLVSSGSIEFAVTGGTGPVTGTAFVPGGASAEVQVNDEPEKPIKNGAFSLGP